MPTTAPYGSWKSPITTDLILANTVGFSQLAIRRRDRLLAGKPPGRKPAATSSCSRTPDGATRDLLPRPLERAHPRPRVRRRRLPGGGRRALLLQLRRPAPVPPGSRRRAPTPHPAPRPALRRLRPGCPAPAPDRRARGPHHRRGDQHPGRRRPGWQRPGSAAGRCSPPGRISTPPRASARMARASPGWNGTTPTCPGTAPPLCVARIAAGWQPGKRRSWPAGG